MPPCRYAELVTRHAAHAVRLIGEGVVVEGLGVGAGHDESRVMLGSAKEPANKMMMPVGGPTPNGVWRC